MQKAAVEKMRRRGFLATGIIFFLYLVLVVWEAFDKGGLAAAFPAAGGIMDAILLIGLAVSVAGLLAMPYYQTRKIMKGAPAGGPRYNFYFYEKSFQYGWGDSFKTVFYSQVQKFRIMEDVVYIQANDIGYLVKMQDFQVGTAEDFLRFMEEKLPEKIVKKKK